MTHCFKCVHQSFIGFNMSLQVVKRSKFDKEEDEMKNLPGENETNYTDSVRSKEDIEVVVINEIQKPSSLKPDDKGK